MIPAAAKTFMIIHSTKFSGNYIELPVVGWELMEGVAVPISLVPCDPDKGVWAVMTPEGNVMDYRDQKAFENIDDWLTYLDTGEVTKRDPLAHVRAETSEVAEAPEIEEVEEDITFGTKTYKTKSYWHHVDTGRIFEIEAETPYPNDENVVKVKRDEYFELRKAGNPVIDPYAEHEEPEEEEIEEEEIEEEDEDEADDASHLI